MTTSMEQPSRNLSVELTSHLLLTLTPTLPLLANTPTYEEQAHYSRTLCRKVSLHEHSWTG